MFLQIYETAKQNGGGTFDICAGEHNPTEGFAVSLRDFEERFTHLSQSRMMEYVARHMSRFAVYGDYFGVWYDSEANEWIFDVTAIVADREQAIICGELNNQKAIWDCANSAEIRLSKIETI